uniref:RxLR effector candidate protein n=2 Tax=Hyaloperonospora arabidopsidis (strain Emoy2) TaxID=559515 RepID=M4B7U5_HYAAE|nr:RxLR effector candidate protein [Hyaloperonospora arabidopsidis Emoy2]
MRVDFTVLVAAATFLTCNEKLLGVLSFPLTDDDNLDLTSDNHEAVPAKRSLKVSDKNSEGRMMLAGGAGDLTSSAVGYLYGLSGGGVALRGTRPAVQLEHQLPTILQMDEQNKPLMEFWHKVAKISIDKVAEVLGLKPATTRTPSFFRAREVRGIKVLRLYIESVNECEKTQHTVLETLTKYYGELELSTVLMKSIRHLPALESTSLRDLQQEMMAGWVHRKLSADKLFDMLKLKDKGGNVLYSTELLTLERYVEARLRGKRLPSQYTDHEAVLPQHRSVALEDGTQLPLHQFERLRDRVVVGVLSKGFGDGEFAIMLVNALGHYSLDDKAKAYMDAMLWRWKDEGKTDLEYVFDAEFFEKHSQHDGETARAIMDRYRTYQTMELIDD